MQIEIHIKSSVINNSIFYSLWTVLLHWLNVQVVRIIQMPCKFFSLKQVALTWIKSVPVS